MNIPCVVPFCRCEAEFIDLSIGADGSIAGVAYCASCAADAVRCLLQLTSQMTFGQMIHTTVARFAAQ